MKVEHWNGHSIRFVEKDGEWWAVLKDICDALGLQSKQTARRIKDEVLSKHLVPDSIGRAQEMIVVNEFGIYDTVFQSRKRAAEEFRYWVYDMLKHLRKSSGLEGFEIFRMLDKEHQKAAMAMLHQALPAAGKVDYIKANTIASKAVCNKYGYPRLLRKEEMTAQMQAERQELLDKTVELMAVKEKFHLDFSVSNQIYSLSSGVS